MHRLFIFGVAMSLMEAAQSQGPPGNLPSCVDTCIEDSFQSSNCLFMGLQNWPCACSIQSFISGIGSCFDNGCSSDNANIGKNFIDIQCSNSISTSIPLPFSPPTSSSSTTSNANVSTSTTSGTSTGGTTGSSSTPPVSPTSSSPETSSSSPPPSGPPSTSGGQQPAPQPTPTPTSPATAGSSSRISTQLTSSSPLLTPASTSTNPVTVTISSGTIGPLPNTTSTSGSVETYAGKPLAMVAASFIVALVYLG